MMTLITVVTTYKANYPNEENDFIYLFVVLPVQSPW